MPNGTRNWLQNLLPGQLSRPDGSWNGRQIADVFIPGDAFRDNEGWRPRGMIAGAANNILPGSGTLIDPPRWLSSAAGGASSFLGSIGRGFSGSGPATMPDFRTTFGRDLNRINEGYMNRGVASPSRFARDRQNMEDRIANTPTFGAGAYVVPQGTASRPRTGSSDQYHLGAGQLGRAGDEALQYYTNTLFNRGGALMER